MEDVVVLSLSKMFFFVFFFSLEKHKEMGSRLSALRLTRSWLFDLQGPVEHDGDASLTMDRGRYVP